MTAVSPDPVTYQVVQGYSIKRSPALEQARALGQFYRDLLLRFYNWLETHHAEDYFAFYNFNGYHKCCPSARAKLQELFIQGASSRQWLELLKEKQASRIAGNLTLVIAQLREACNLESRARGENVTRIVESEIVKDPKWRCGHCGYVSYDGKNWLKGGN